MQGIKARPINLFFRPNRILFILIILAALIATGLYSYNNLIANGATAPKPMVSISQDTLAKKYGLRVLLIGTTAAGGLVDVRLKIVDAQKAEALLGDRANYPALLVGKDVVIKASEDIVQQPIKFENDASIYSLYSNAGNSIKPGVLVTLVFGDLRLEPIPAK